MATKWKVRVLRDMPAQVDDGNGHVDDVMRPALVEEEFVGALAELGQAFADDDVRVVQFAGAVEVSGSPADAARGSDSVVVEKSDVGQVPDGIA